MSSSTSQDSPPQQPSEIGMDTLAEAEKLLGLEFTDDERLLMLEDVAQLPELYARLRSAHLENAVSPALHFDPRPMKPLWTRNPAADCAIAPSTTPAVGEGPKRPEDLEELAFLSIGALAWLLKSRQVTSFELTNMYLGRLKRYGPQLNCVITLTEDLALEQAKRADAEIVTGRYRGPLHGIPWGAKDLLATRNIPTTWGAAPLKDQVFDRDATVVQKLEAAGAVLVAKLSMGALAWGDVWFGGKTRNPWNLDEGASGSSAGSAAATAAGLVGFSIGTETYGSIVSPCTECGATGLRPTFGRVSRAGAMALSWSMDKIGPICRTVADCGLVFDAIRGTDGEDATVRNGPFNWPKTVDLGDVRIGYTKELFDAVHPKPHRNNHDNEQTSLQRLRELGATLQPIELPSFPHEALELIVAVEAAAAFDELTSDNLDDELVRQTRDAWPNRFRTVRFVSAVEYVQANRIRTQLIEQMGALMDELDLYLAPTWSPNLLLTNLTGHPAVVVPNGFRANGLPASMTFTGRLGDEETVLAVAKVYQDATDFHQKYPPLFYSV